MNRRTQRKHRTNSRGATVNRRDRMAAIEVLEPRGMLSGIPLTFLPPTLRDASVVAPPAVVAALRVTLPPSSPNGLPVVALISAVDAAGRPVFSASATVTLASSDPAATLPASVQLVNGRGVVPVTFRTAGPQTLTATDAADPTRTATASTTVAQPVVAAKLVVMLPPQVRAGLSTMVTALAVDAAGRPVPTFNGTASVTSSDAAASLPLIEVLFKNGRATFPVSFATAGKQTVTVTSLADATVTGSGSTTVAAPQALASFLVMVPPRVVTGMPVNVAIVALDAARRPINGYTGTATLSSSDAAATLPPTVTFTGGRAIARVTFATPGEQTLSVRGVAGDIVAAATVSVVAAPVATRFAVMLPRAVPAGMPVPVVLVALDDAGRPVVNFSGSVTLTSSDAAATFPSSVTFVNGRAVVRVVFGTLGEQTLTATSGSIAGTGKTKVGEVTIQPVI
jgi:hypothetical protein